MGGSGIVNGIEHTSFDNFYLTPIKIDDYVFPSSEHAFQALKFKNSEYIERIIQSEMGVAWQLGHTYDEPFIDGWNRKLPKKIKGNPLENCQIALMYRVNFEKFSQNSELKEELKKTAGYPIHFEASSHFWNQWNQWILEKIRDEI